MSTRRCLRPASVAAPWCDHSPQRLQAAAPGAHHLGSPPLPMGVVDHRGGAEGQAPASTTAARACSNCSRISCASLSGSVSPGGMRVVASSGACRASSSCSTLCAGTQPMVLREGGSRGGALPWSLPGGRCRHRAWPASRRYWRLSRARSSTVRQVAAQQGEVVLVVHLADAAQQVGGVLVVQVAHQGVARIGGHGHHAAFLQQGGGLLKQARLGFSGELRNAWAMARRSVGGLDALRQQIPDRLEVGGQRGSVPRSVCDSSGLANRCRARRPGQIPVPWRHSSRLRRLNGCP